MPVSWYPLRVGCACGFASLLPLLCARVPAAASVFALPLFAPIAASVTAAPLQLGAALKNGTYVAEGIVAGALLTSTALAAISAVPPDSVDADASTYVSLALLALLILYPAFPPLTAKFAMNCVIISLFTAPDAPSARAAALLPLRLALTTLLGVAVALVVCAAPWPDGRASAQLGAQLAAAEQHVGALGALLARGFGESTRTARVLTVRADAHRAAAAACDDALHALEDTTAWEAWAGTAQPRAASQRQQLLREALSAFDGAALAMAAARAAEAQHTRVMSRALLRASIGAATSVDAATNAEDDLNKIDALLLDPIRTLGGAAAGALHAATAMHSSPNSDACSSPLGCAEEDLAAALDSFDTQLLAARREVYYGPLPPSFVDPRLSSLGPPVEHYAFFFCLRSFAATALRSVQGARKRPAVPADGRKLRPGVLTAVAATLRPVLAALTHAPDAQRLLYAAKLVVAVISAAWLGRLTCGSGLWSAITAQIVGAREGVFAGGSFRLATSRLTGTVLGAMYGYFLLSVLGHKSAPYGAVLPLLALWVALCGLVRASPRTAYIGLVAQFTPYIIALDAPQSAVSSNTFAYRRIEQNLIGILAFVAVEFLVLPRAASSLLLAALADTMRATADVASAAWDPVLLGERCDDCNAAGAAAAADARAKLAASVVHARALLTEATDEPAWMRRVALLPPLRTLVQLHETTLAAVLNLMHAAAAEAAVHGAETLHGGILHSAAELRDALRVLFTTLAADLDAGASSDAAVSAALAVEQRMAAFEADYDAALGRLRGAYLADDSCGIPPTQVVLPLDALIFCTRQLVALGEQVDSAVREALRSEGNEELPTMLQEGELSAASARRRSEHLSEHAAMRSRAQSARAAGLCSCAMAEELMPVTLADLPDASVARVLSFLTSLEELRSAELACKLLARVSWESRAWVALAARYCDGLQQHLSAAPALLPFRDAVPAWAPPPRALCKRLAALACAPTPTGGAASLLAEALAASSTDNPAEALRNTLSARTRNADWNLPCYWSSSGSDTRDGVDTVTYRLAAPLCVVHSVQIRPFRAYFQRGYPIYSPLRVRVLLGGADEDAGGYGGVAAATGQFHYESPEFAVEQADTLQTLTLPRPVLCVGGVVRLVLLGRAQTQASDGRWYVCLVHVRALGTPCYGWSVQPGGLAFDVTAPLARAPRLPALVAEADGSDTDDEDEEDEEPAGFWVVA